MSLPKAAQRLLQAIDAALPYAPHRSEFDVVADATDDLRAALAAPTGKEDLQVEPVAWMDIDSDGNRLSVRQWSDGNREEAPLYLAPPQRKPLTEQQLEQAKRDVWRNLPAEFDHTTSSWIEAGIRYAERAHGIGGQDESA